jgi:hypothetical protein
MSRIGLQCCYSLLKEIKLFAEKNNQKMKKELDDGWMSNLVLFVYVTGRFRTLKKELKGKD